MSRYLYYLIIVTMVTNIIASVPKILMSESKNGVIISMIIAVIAGVILTTVVINLFSYFPSMTLPEILKQSTSKWVYYPVLFYFAVSWYLAGLITLITYVFLFNTFLSYETSITITTLAFILIASFGVLMKEKSVLYTTELVLVLFLPVIFILLLKAYADPQLEWDFVKVAIMNINKEPSYTAFSASTYVFIGAVNIIIFNKFMNITQRIGIKQVIFLGLVGIFSLFTTYFIPIGFNGFEQIENLNFPWVSTSDSIRLRYGIIERVIFVFVIVFLGVAFISLLIHWHVSLKLFESIFHFKKLKWKSKNLTSYLFVFLFGVMGIISTRQINEYQLFKYSSYFYNTLPIFYVILISILLFAKRRSNS
ncbi:GerAB/ArcD/ProY family transporter [Bacillus sp. Cr_A10]|uniref:GerAB/ArcD/ProY family transporter n=1 Tax=Bacillus sp. Cr_A10 TaxID=3033993 RepID=UPI0023DADE02|nr:GerAB/ArcD/ProY family transporter [Bacillus sp. Cr_A10]MDF2066402.1 GerAB/ArcD/ProY family transporter [Bacillus sp. Cr_A10]